MLETMTEQTASVPTHPTPVIIVGAARSGTNMLRDALAKLPGFATWDCDEINPVWRNGRPLSDPDEFSAESLSPRQIGVIRNAFNKLAGRHPDARFLIEKTCANTLRLDAVDRAMPDAKYVRIIRHGHDVVASAKKRWSGELEVEAGSYFLSKVRNAPLAEIPKYAFHTLRNRIGRRLTGRSRLDTWGPRYAGIESDLDRPLEEICALQWRASMAASDAFFEKLPEDRYVALRYEDFVSDPVEGLKRIAATLGAAPGADELAAAVSDISVRSVGKGRKAGKGENESAAGQIMAPLLDRHGYTA